LFNSAFAGSNDAAQELANQAKEKLSGDNISVVVVYLQKSDVLEVIAKQRPAIYMDPEAPQVMEEVHGKNDTLACFVVGLSIEGMMTKY
jgi:serine/threonine protein phosphatase PrpC